MELEHFHDVYSEWKAVNITAVQASKVLGITRTTFYNKVKIKKTEKLAVK